MARRVVVWGTGNLGQIAIRAIGARRDLELVGVGVRDPAKAGRDAGSLAGLEENGVIATADLAALIALCPDCAVYAGTAEHQSTETMANLGRFLAAGINVVTTSSTTLMHPPSMAPELRGPLQQAAAEGGASILATGIEPGFAGDHFPLMLTMMSETVRSIRVQEIFRYDGYPVASALRQGMGFGMAMEFAPLMAAPAVQIAMWGPSLRKVAEHLGARIDDIRCTFEKRITERDLHVACGRIEAGTVGALRFETIAVVGGFEPIVIEHVNRMADDIAPDWPTAHRNGTYRVIVEGSPNLTCDLVVGSAESFSYEGRVATAMLMVNAIPYVCDAAPGLLTALDLPLATPRGVFV